MAVGGVCEGKSGVRSGQRGGMTGRGGRGIFASARVPRPVARVAAHPPPPLTPLKVTAPAQVGRMSAGDAPIRRGAGRRDPPHTRVLASSGTA